MAARRRKKIKPPAVVSGSRVGERVSFVGYPPPKGDTPQHYEGVVIDSNQFRLIVEVGCDSWIVAPGDATLIEQKDSVHG